MEAIVFGGRKVVVPAALEGMRDLTVTLGGVACEQRMIGWRIGWIVASATVTPQLGMVHIYNGLVASGFNQLGAIAALRADDHAAGVAEWERRHDMTMEQLAGLPAIPAHGGWSLLLDAEAAGMTAPDLSATLLEHKVAATPMTAWGETVAPRHVRFVYSNEPVERLAALGERVPRSADPRPQSAYCNTKALLSRSLLLRTTRRSPATARSLSQCATRSSGDGRQSSERSLGNS
jgi:aspartate/methionine/tyrosine aminotransferase